MSPSEISSAADGTATRTVISAGQSRGWKIGFGALTLVAGVLMLIWPDATVLVVAVILGIQLIVAGIVRIVTALTEDIDGGTRALYLLLGLLLVVVGIFCLRSPFHATAILVLLFGLSWIVNGVIEMFHGVTGGGGWLIVSGAISLLAGIVVLAYPTPSVVAMVWLFGIALIVIGVMAIVSGVVAGRATATSPGWAGPRVSGETGPAATH
jgi:uncharacterized membrane protein HdeD (DUF308 family)